MELKYLKDLLRSKNNGEKNIELVIEGARRVNDFEECQEEISGYREEIQHYQSLIQQLEEEMERLSTHLKRYFENAEKFILKIPDKKKK